MRVKRLTLAMIVLLCAFGSSGHAQTRPDSLSGASRAQFARLQQDRDTIASKLGLSRRTVNSIAAIAIGKNADFTDAQLVNAIRSQAEAARRLLDENATLAARLRMLEDPSARDPGLAALQSARAAIDDGRFGDAESEYAQVRAIRWTEIAGGQSDWDAAVSGQAWAAVLAGEFDRAEDIRLSAAREAAANLRDQANRIEIGQYTQAAAARYFQGINFGSREALDRAIQILASDVLPRMSQTEDPETWAET